MRRAFRRGRTPFAVIPAKAGIHFALSTSKWIPAFAGMTNTFLPRFFLALLVGLSTPIHAAVDPLPFKDRAEEVRFQVLTKQLRCLVCQNESLNDSAAPLAADLRRDVFEQMRAGKSDAQIKQWLTARYSDFVLYDPPLRGGTWLLWFGPLLVLLGGGAALFSIVRRRARAAHVAPPAGDDGDDW
jgi:cytochrome c-type biogenesis protein CcmH